MNAIFIFSTPWAFDPDQRIHEIRIAGPPMTPLVPNASLNLKGTRSRILSAAIFSVFTSRPLSMAVGPLRRIDLVARLLVDLCERRPLQRHPSPYLSRDWALPPL